MEFKEVKELARGGMSVVYEAFSESLGRPVVLKKIHPALASDPDFSGRLEQEAAILSGLSHPGIVGFLGARKISGAIPVIGSGSLPAGSFFLILEKIDGASLEKIVGREGPPSMERGLLLFVRICEALAYLHERNVFHLDLNPSNILTRRNGEPVLADFGLSTLQGVKGRTLPLDFKPATLAYLSPEEAAGLPGDGKSDLFALGMTFYYLLEGRGYFDGESPSSIWRRLVYDAGRFDLRFSRPVPEYFRTMLQKMVSRRPEERYSDAGALLRMWKAGKGPSLGLVETPLPLSPERNTLIFARKGTGLGALLLTGLLFILSVIWLTEPSRVPAWSPSAHSPSAPPVHSVRASAPENVRSDLPALLPPILPVSAGLSDLDKKREESPAEDEDDPEFP